jgi:apolipoprotein N-acyltransferase
MPEKIARVSDQGRAQVDELFGATAARANAEIVVGIDRGSATSRFNEARIYSPGGAIETYDKHHMIPRFEDFDQPGTTLTVWNQPSGIWGIEICKDMDFPRLSRRYGAQGVAMLLVPAWDFVLDDWLHGRMAILRGVESGFTIARTAKQGLMTVSDNRGRVLAERGSAAAPFSYIFAIVPVRHDSTLYLRWGNWFAWLNVAGLILIVLSLFWKRGSAS